MAADRVRRAEQNESIGAKAFTGLVVGAAMAVGGIGGVIASGTEGIRTAAALWRVLGP